MKLFTISIFTLFMITAGWAQELLVGGNMEDENAWLVSHLDSVDPTEYEFNYVADGPAEGQGGCLYVTCIGDTSTNLFFYQEVTLTGGTEYELKGAFKDLAGTIASFWCEVLYDTAAIPDNADMGGILVCGFNTWDGTQAGIDGTFQDDYVKGDGPIFTAIGDVGVPITAYFGVNVGCWLGGTSYFWEVAIDELSLTPTGGAGIEENQVSIPGQFSLHQNFPNPFNPQTTISYSLPRASTITLKVYDIMGQEIATLLQNDRKAAGIHKISFDATNLPCGTYFYRLQADGYLETKKMLLIK